MEEDIQNGLDTGQTRGLENGVRRLSDASNSNSDSSQKNFTDDENEDRLKQKSMYDLMAAKSFNEKLDNNKMTGYLEKRSKMLGWKRFWFVLDGRLLTYFKSKSDYESLSPFNGSINLGIATHVSPIKANKGFPFQIVTRTQVYYLRVLQKPELDRWLIAIQEAATIPPNISLPVWVDPGIQFYRYSFTSASQWSLSASTEDLTSSKKEIPLNFYRPSSILKKCHSFASLNYNGTKSHKNNKKSERVTSLDNNNKFYTTPFSYSSHFEDLGLSEMQEIIPRNKNNLHKMRHTSSMLVLESSAQAGELRRELAQKLGSSPIPNSRGTNNKPEQQQEDDSDLPQMIFPKTLRLFNQQQQHNISTGNPTMYTNTGYPQTTEVNHEYDEIGDLDQGIYEPCGSPLEDRQRRKKKTESIYENVENQSHPQDPWERLPNFNKTVKNSNPLSRSGPDLILPRNRRSLQHRESTGRNSLGSIAEMPEKEGPAPNLSKVKDLEIQRMSGPSSLPLTSSRDSWDRSNDSTEIAEGDEKSKKKKRHTKKGSISRFLQKIFNKSDTRRRDGEDPRDMVITGPVDLRKPSMEFSSQERLSKNNNGKNSTHSHTGQSKRQNPQNVPVSKNMTGSKPAIGPSLISSDKLLEELNQKIGQMKRSNSDGSTFGFPSQEKTKSMRKSLSHSDAIVEERSIRVVESSQQSNRSSITSYSDSSTGPRSRSDSNANPTVETQSTTDSEEFLRKLARFNRLSASLNPSFIAALQGHSLGGGSIGSKIGRSYSCRVRPTEEPPVLPPKKKQNPMVSVYDVPKNNSPVVCPTPGQNKSRNSTLRELAKKSSAPDISFSTSNTSSSPSGSTSSEPTSLLRKSLLETQDQVFIGDDFHSSLCPPSRHSYGKALKAPKPPPRPPKSQTNNSFVQVFPQSKPQVCQNIHGNDSTINSVDNDHADDYCNLGVIDDTPNCDYTKFTIDEPEPIKTDLPENDDDDNNVNESVSENSEEHTEDSHNTETSLETETPSQSEIISLDLKTMTDEATTDGNEEHEEMCTKTEKMEPESSVNDKNEEEKVEEKASCIQSSEILESPLTCLATLEIFEQSNKSTLKYVEAPIRHHAEILEIPDLLKIQLQGQVRSFSPTPSDGMEILSDISNSNSPPTSPLERPHDMSIIPPAKRQITNDNFGPTTITTLGQENDSIDKSQDNAEKEFQTVDSITIKLNKVMDAENNDQQVVNTLVNEPPLELDDDGSHLYDDVPFEQVNPEEEKKFVLNYASCHSVAWETVEETEEEAYEMYDDFPADDFIFSATAASKTATEMQRVHDKPTLPQESVFRHSGIDQLQAFLSNEMKKDEDMISTTDRPLEESNNFKFNHSNQKIRPAVSRLGHSSAVEQLKKIVSHNNGS